MRKKISLSMLLCLLLTTFLAVSMINPTQADIEGTPTWIGPKYDRDDFHGIATTFIAFTTGTDATLRVTIKNTLAAPLNVSAVKVLMDWSTQNISSTEASQSSPRVIPKFIAGPIYYYYTFTIVFQVPAITTASNLFRHYYWVYVDVVNATTGPQKVTNHATAFGSDFTVYSADQATAQDTRMEYTRLNSTFTPTSQAAKELKKKSEVEYSAGLDSYKRGDFADAKTHYITALSLLKDARSTEETYQTTIQENTLNSTKADIMYKEAQAKQYESYAKQNEANAKQAEAYAYYYNTTAVKQADAAMIQANATMKEAEAQWAIAQAINLQSTALNLFGFGFILFGVAAIIWAFKRPKPT